MRERRSLRKRSNRDEHHLSLCVHSRDCSVSVKERVVITKGHGHNTHNSQRTDGERQTMPQQRSTNESGSPNERPVVRREHPPRGSPTLTKRKSGLTANFGPGAQAVIVCSRRVVVVR